MKLRSQGRGRRRKQRRRRRRRRSKRKKLGKEPWRDLAAFILHFTVRSGAIGRFFFPPSLFLIFRSTFSLFLHFSLSLSLSPLNSFFFPSFSASSEIESVTPTRSIKRPASNSSAETNDVPSVNFRLFCRVLVFFVVFFTVLLLMLLLLLLLLLLLFALPLPLHQTSVEFRRVVIFNWRLPSFSTEFYFCKETKSKGKTKRPSSMFTWPRTAPHSRSLRKIVASLRRVSRSRYRVYYRVFRATLPPPQGVPSFVALVTGLSDRICVRLTWFYRVYLVFF